jgi:hypothetical protein
MMLNIKQLKWVIVAMLISMVSTTSVVNAQENRFSDVSADYWAEEVISWGVERKMLSGYGDGTFAPRKAVTEAEFLKIVIAAYEDLPQSGESWYDRYYAYAFKKGWYVKGLKDKTYVNKPILRKQAAIILSSALGNSYRSDDADSTVRAINELYNKDLSNGRTEKTVEGFATEEQLTRAEAVQFVYTFVTKSGIENLKASVSDADWAAFEKVDFTDNNAVLDKHKLFAKKYGLEVTTYQSADWKYINFVSQAELSSSKEGDNFNLSSAYKLDSDGTLKWELIANLDKEDAFVALELLSRMFSYETLYYNSINLKLLPTIEFIGVKIDGRMEADFGKLNILTRYDKETNNYYISSTVAP